MVCSRQGNSSFWYSAFKKYEQVFFKTVVDNVSNLKFNKRQNKKN